VVVKSIPRGLANKLEGIDALGLLRMVECIALASHHHTELSHLPSRLVQYSGCGYHQWRSATIIHKKESRYKLKGIDALGLLRMIECIGAPDAHHGGMVVRQVASHGVSAKVIPNLEQV
jgi:hypothetical protein